MMLFPKKITSRKQVFRFTVLVGAYTVISTIAVTAILLKITGKDIPGIYGFSVAVPLVVAPPIAYWLVSSIYEITLLRDEIERFAYTDELTGIGNRRAFFEQARKMISASKDTDDIISIILVDLDHFKNLNDTYGHQAGDAILALVAKILVQSICNIKAVVGRIGGEEFALLVIHRNGSDNSALAEKIRGNIKSASIGAGATRVSATASIGLALVNADNSLEAALLSADKALYLAKKSGRDRIASYQAEV